MGAATESGFGALFPVSLAWDANPEPDVTGYFLSYGTEPGVYGQRVDVGQTTSASLNLPAGGTFYVVAIAYTNAGLESPASDEIRVVTKASADLQPPVFTRSPGNILTAPASAGSTWAVVTWLEPLATDDSGVVNIIGSHRPGDLFRGGTTTVTYTASDATGNTSSLSFEVTVGGMSVWLEKVFGAEWVNPDVAGEMVDVDNDGWSNLSEYALGLQPLRTDGQDVLFHSIEGGVLQIKLLHNPFLPDVALRIEVSSNLRDWRPCATLLPDGTWSAGVTGLNILTQRVGPLQLATLSEPLGTRTALFHRLALERLPVR